jgi:hypothetical protein
LVERLGLATNLRECNVDESEVPKIVKISTGGTEPNHPIYKKVESLVETLY